MEKITALPIRFMKYISPSRQTQRPPSTDLQLGVQNRSQSTSPLARLLSWKTEIRAIDIPFQIDRKRRRSNLVGSDDLPSGTHRVKRAKVNRGFQSDESDPALGYGDVSETGSLAQEEVEYDESICGDDGEYEVADQTRSTFSDPTSEWDNVLDEHDESLVVSKSQEYRPPTAAAFEREYARREKETAALSVAGWSPSSVVLFRKLAMRGFEPLMPWEWCEREFLAFPTALFTKDDNQAFIKGINRDGCLGPHRATKALNVLLNLGDRVRAKQLIKLDPGHWIKHEINAYVRWSLRDAPLYKKVGYAPMLAVQVAGASRNGHELQVRMVKRLRRLSREWRQALDELPKTEKIEQPPSVYGIIVSQTVLAFVAYIPKQIEDEGDELIDPASELHTVGLFDYSDGGYDVWNTLAVAIFVIHCRNQLVELVEAAPSIITGDKPESPDPDL